MLGLGNSISRSSVSESGASALRLVSPLLLDTYSGAVAAYSLRKLSSDYSGKAIQIRRASDNVEVDVSFDSSGAVSLDSAVTNVTEETTGSSTSLVTSATNLGQFVANASYTDADSLGSADSALVQCWYDQSGSGNHATQNTAGSQPQIVSSGAIVVENEKSAVNFNGSSSKMSSSNVQNNNDTSVAFVGTRSNVSARNNTVSHHNGNDHAIYSYGADDYKLWDGGAYGSGSGAVGTNQHTFFHNSDGTTVLFYLNDSLLYNVTRTLKQGTTAMEIGSWNGVSLFSGTMQEIVVWGENKLSNRADINTNINTFYDIYS